jgi:hypothetical protein
MQQRKCWINTVSQAHVAAGVRGGFTQADHGRATRLKRLAKGDLIAFYSPRTEFQAGESLQAFIALGCIRDEKPYQVEMAPDFHPWRRQVEFFDGHEAPIRPLLEILTFIPDKSRWGMVFRRGLFEVPYDDLARIATAMGVRLDEHD